MVNKSLVFAVIGFMLGGLVVSTAAVTFEKDDKSSNSVQMTDGHTQTMANKLKNLQGDDFDKAFIEEMIVHHQGAIDMAKLTETNAKHEELKSLGRNIMSAQSMEIDMMQTWQGDWEYKSVPKSHDMNNM